MSSDATTDKLGLTPYRNSYVVRATEPHEYLDAVNAKGLALLQRPIDATRFETLLPTWEPTSTFSAWDGDLCVGHAAAFHTTLTVPGGERVTNAGVTRVGVLPTHKRRGIARQLINRLIKDSDERGSVTMTLIASEPEIYSRYGFGISSWTANYEFDPRRLGPPRGATTEGSFYVLDRNAVIDVMPDLFDRVALGRPGAFGRPDYFYPQQYDDVIDGSAARFIVVHQDQNGTTDGFVCYTAGFDNGFASGSTSSGTVEELFGIDDGVELALWSFICGIDLVDKWQAIERPVDDLIRIAAANPRALKVTLIEDDQWLRLVDVDRALRARTYKDSPHTVTITVSDELIERNNATWRVGSGGVDSISSHSATADIITPVGVLSAAFLGGTSWADLVAVGDATATLDAARRADELFRVDRAPQSGSRY